MQRCRGEGPAVAFAGGNGADLKLAGAGIHIVYQRNSPANPVTGRSVRQQVHLYVFFLHGRLITFQMFGAVGADNVDPYAKMSRSLRLF